VPSRLSRALVLVGGSVVLAAGSAIAAADNGPHLRFRSEQQTTIVYNQGVARVPGGWILTGTDLPVPATDTIARVNDNLTVLEQVPGAIPPQWRAQGFDHIGDIDVYKGLIYAPFEQPDYPKGVQATATYDARTLLFRKAWTIHQHENSFVTIDPGTGVAFSMQHSNGRYLTRNDADHNWKHLPPLRMSKELFHTQGADVARGYVWISTSDKNNDIYRVNERTGKVDHLGRHRHPGGEGEGLDASILPSGDLHTLMREAGSLTMWLEHGDAALGGGGAGPRGGGSDNPGRPPSGAREGNDGNLATTGGLPPLAWAGAVLGVVAVIARRLVSAR